MRNVYVLYIPVKKILGVSHRLCIHTYIKQTTLFFIKKLAKFEIFCFLPDSMISNKVKKGVGERVQVFRAVATGRRNSSPLHLIASSTRKHSLYGVGGRSIFSYECPFARSYLACLFGALPRFPRRIASGQSPFCPQYRHGSNLELGSILALQ